MLSFLLRDARETPPLPLKVGQSTLHWSVLAGPSHGIPNGGGSGRSQKHREKKGRTADSTLRGRRKDMFLLKINMSDVLQVHYNKRRKKEMSLFSIIIQTCSTKTTNHIHKPLIGTVYLSENIIEPKNKKSCFFKSVS